jgi:hypothetical protein
LTSQPPPPPSRSDLPVPVTPNYGSRQPAKVPDHDRRPAFNGWKLATQGLSVVVVVLLAITLLSYFHIINPTPSTTAAAPTPTQGVAGAPGTTPVTNTPTLAATQGTTPGNTPSSTPTQPQSDPRNYSTIKPGPGCDSNGGTWTPQGITNIDCSGTNVTFPGNARAYLFLQLPNNTPFSPNNRIGVIGGPYSSTCVGLAEQDANTGFLGEYCGNGNWYIYSISNDGTIVQTLDKGLTSTRQSPQIALMLKGTTLSFSIDSEVHDARNITPIPQPTKVAITYFSTYYEGKFATNNFSYTVLPN